MPSTTVRIPPTLRRYTAGLAEVTGQGATVGEILDDLERRYPGLGPALLDGGQVRRFVNLYVGETDIRFAQGLATELGTADVLTILPGIAGG
jgi:molybdopterin synthase sulfur carrier subunit